MAAEFAAAVKAESAKIIDGIKETGLEGTEGKEVKSSEFSDIAKKKDVLDPDIDKVKGTTLESILQENKEKIYEDSETYDASETNETQEGNVSNENVDDSNESKEGLTDEEKQKMKKEMGWLDKIIDNIQSMEEYKIYKNAALHEAEIGEKKALIRSDIDWKQVDEKGRTNEERIKRGLAPLDKTGTPIELHHIGQHENSPLAELTFKEHRCNGNDIILHDKKKETETHGEGNTWDSQRQEYWKNRADYSEEISEKKEGGN